MLRLAYLSTGPGLRQRRLSKPPVASALIGARAPDPCARGQLRPQGLRPLRLAGRLVCRFPGGGLRTQAACGGRSPPSCPAWNRAVQRRSTPTTTCLRWISSNEEPHTGVQRKSTRTTQSALQLREILRAPHREEGSSGGLTKRPGPSLRRRGQRKPLSEARSVLYCWVGVT